jgi:hypothetical protein
MAIHLNLLAEQQAEALAKQRDPVKRSIWLGGVLISLVLISWVYLHLRVWLIKEQFAAAETEWQTIVTNYNQLVAITNQINECEKKMAALSKLSTNRFLWAPILNVLQYSDLQNIHLTSIRVDQKIVPNVITKKIGDKTLRQTNYEELVTMNIDGKVYGPQPIDYVSKFKASLINSSYLKNLGRTNEINLKNIQKIEDTTGGSAEKSNVSSFNIECKFLLGLD